MPSQRNPIYTAVVLGPTASGKSSLAVALAKNFKTDVIHADSRQIYCGMDIGTAKPNACELSSVKHHLLSVVAPDSVFSAEDFARKAALIINELHLQNKLPLIEGGTGFYIRALVYGLFRSPPSSEDYRNYLKKMEENKNGILFKRLMDIDPSAAARIHPNDKYRIVRALEVYHLTGVTISCLQKENSKPVLAINPIYIGLLWPRDILYERIDSRVQRMIEQGLIDEVKTLVDAGYDTSLPSMQSLGYAQICKYLKGEKSLEESVEDIKRESRRYAKRQMTWFRKNQAILWLNPLDDNYFKKAVDFINKNCFYTRYSGC